MSRLWSKGVGNVQNIDEIVQLVDEFTVGNDRALDMRLAKSDVLGSKAHIKMLESIGLLTKEEEVILQGGLDEILEDILEGKFKMDDDVEDIHSQVEFILTEKFGDIGKKIHSGRSRNDQVLVDLKLYLKEEVETLRDEVMDLFNELQLQSEKYKEVLMPGYTHSQVAMPSSFGLWFGAFAETLVDDMYMLKGAYNVLNQNPLGSAAGYGSSFPLDRDMTTKELGFGEMNYNVVAAQMSRGKSERALACAMSHIAITLNRLASDSCIYMAMNYGFFSFPENLTTGSSIMPHKKNPDVWEIIRANCNRIQSLPTEIALMTTNMMSGYHRDYQLLKDVLFPALDLMHRCLYMAKYMIENIIINEDILADQRYNYLFTVEEINRRVLEGVPFRDAYKAVGREVNRGEFKFSGAPQSGITKESLNHQHKGSMGNLCNAEIALKMNKIWAEK